MLGERLRQIRMEKELSQAEVAKMLGVSQQAVANYETGLRQPDTLTLTKLAQIFNVSTDWLLGLTNLKKFDLDIDNIAAMRSREMEGYNDLTKEEQEFLRNFVREYYERFGKKKESE